MSKADDLLRQIQHELKLGGGTISLGLVNLLDDYLKDDGRRQQEGRASATKPDSAASPPVVLLPCPFCGSRNIDPEEWASLERAGPGCDDRGATADTIELWNQRASAAEPERDALQKLSAHEHKQLEFYRNATAAAEPEKPVAWYMPIGRYGHLHWGTTRPDVGNINEWRPLYASPAKSSRPS